MATATEMVTAAKAGVENLTPAEVADEIENAEVLLVDIREPNETEQEIIEGALLAPRGMLEFYADPSTPYHLEEFERDRRIVLYCSAGSRSALGAQTLQEIGYSNIAHLDGGIKGWKEAGYPVEVRHES
jgi:rhodanese-related sulfurtransferase